MRTRFFTFILIFSILFLSACAPAHYGFLKRDTVEDVTTVTGSFTLIQYGNRHGDDLETVAFLDIENDAYTFEPHAPSFDYKLKKNLNGEDALEEAIRFVGKHTSFRGARISRLSDDQGNVLGFEVRPFYRDTRFRSSDLISVNYSVKEKKVLIFIRLKRFVEKHFEIEDRHDSN
ncbi:MAG: hypothetical protein JSV71_05500 [Nitrospiraceae bacterium]|nr:MAG: hypothetical protein JSV71_05500 [Nitrospiraceae bacterium]